MTTYVTVPAPAPVSPASHRLLLWLPVPVALAVAFLLVRGDAAITEGVRDLDPLYGLGPLLVGLVCAVVGVVSLVLACVFSFVSPAVRAGGALGAALWSTLSTGALVALVTWGTATDQVLERSSTAGAQYPWQVAALVVAALPLAAVVVARTLPGAERDA